MYIIFHRISHSTFSIHFPPSLSGLWTWSVNDLISNLIVGKLFNSALGAEQIPLRLLTVLYGLLTEWCPSATLAPDPSNYATMYTHTLAGSGFVSKSVPFPDRGTGTGNVYICIRFAGTGDNLLCFWALRDETVLIHFERTHHAATRHNTHSDAFLDNSSV